MSVIDLSSIVTYMYTVAHLEARVHNNNWYQTTSLSIEEAAGSNKKQVFSIAKVRGKTFTQPTWSY